MKQRSLTTKFALMQRMKYKMQYILYSFGGDMVDLSPRGSIVDRGEVEVDNAFQWVTAYYVFP